MAYNTEELKEKALEVIKKKNLFFIEDVVAFLPCSKVTFYNHKLNELNSIKEALEKNRVKTKNGLRSKWYMSGAPAVQIALYKLLANEDEMRKLNSQYIDHTTGGEQFKKFEGFNFLPGGEDEENEGNQDITETEGSV